MWSYVRIYLHMYICIWVIVLCRQYDCIKGNHLNLSLIFQINYSLKIYCIVKIVKCLFLKIFSS